jgi:hypothetical protein
MESEDTASWQLEDPGGSGVDAVEEALARDAARLSYGHHAFDYSRKRTPGGGLLITLSHRADSRCQREGRQCRFTWLNGLISRRIVPVVEDAADDEQLALIEQRQLRTVGRGFFADMARLIDHAESSSSQERTHIRYRHIRRSS